MPDSLVFLGIVLLSFVLAMLLRERLLGRRAPRGYRVKICAPAVRRTARKPAWVKREVLRLAALTDAGCRTIEKLFNRLYARRRAMTVGKSYVSYTIRDHLYEIEVLRRSLKHRVPRAIPRNQLWALDLTGKEELAGDQHAILGIEDHGSRKLLALEALECKNAWTLLGRLFLVVGRFGKPRMLRTDNESMFRSIVFRLVLWIAGIRQQFTVPGCPWQNGRIERLFGTLKAKLDRMEVDGREALAGLLGEFRFWYNAVRPHQHLGGLTPEEAWRGIDPYARTESGAPVRSLGRAAARLLPAALKSRLGCGRKTKSPVHGKRALPGRNSYRDQDAREIDTKNSDEPPITDTRSSAHRP